MKLFEQLPEQTVNNAKENLQNIVKMNVTKYLTLQESIIDLLSSGKSLEPSEKAKGKKGKKHLKECGFCRLNSMLTAVSSYKDIAAEAANQYELCFGEELDMDAIFLEISNDLSRKRNSSNEFVLDKQGNITMPSDAPQEVKEMMSVIKEALNRNGFGGNMSMEVIDLKADNHGLKPEDFDNFGEYAKAVSKKRAEFAKNTQGKSGEEIINEAVILSAEKAVDSSSEKTKEKLN